MSVPKPLPSLEYPANGRWPLPGLEDFSAKARCPLQFGGLCGKRPSGVGLEVVPFAGLSSKRRLPAFGSEDSVAKDLPCRSRSRFRRLNIQQTAAGRRPAWRFSRQRLGCPLQFGGLCGKRPSGVGLEVVPFAGLSSKRRLPASGLEDSVANDLPARMSSTRGLLCGELMMHFAWN